MSASLAMAHPLTAGCRHLVIPCRRLSKELDKCQAASTRENEFCVRCRCQGFRPSPPMLRPRAGRFYDTLQARTRILAVSGAKAASNTSPEIAIDAENICLTLGQAEVRLLLHTAVQYNTIIVDACVPLQFFCCAHRTSVYHTTATIRFYSRMPVFFSSVCQMK